MALVEIKLLDASKPIEDAHITDAVVGKIPGQEFDALKLLKALRFKKLSLEEMKIGASGGGQFRLSVKIFNTTLEVDAIYRWIGEVLV